MSWMCPLCGCEAHPLMMVINSVNPQPVMYQQTNYPTYTNTAGYLNNGPSTLVTSITSTPIILYQCHKRSVLFTDPSRFCLDNVNEENVVKAQAIRELAQ